MSSLTIPWVLKLRWGALLGQMLVLIIGEFVLALNLPLIPLGTLLSLFAISNIIAGAYAKKVSAESLVKVLILFDTVLLTALLSYSGGVSNPFSIFYLVHIALAASLLNERWTWATALLSIACFGLLFVTSIEIPALAHGHHDPFSLHLQGMWFAFGLAALLTAFFQTRILASLARQREELKKLDLLRAEQQKLSAITTLAAGAAHELGTPLQTISLVASELSTRSTSPQIAEDARLIFQEVSRCKNILDELGLEAKEYLHEQPETLDPATLRSGLELVLGSKSFQNLNLSFDSSISSFAVPRSMFLRSLAALIKNGFDAGADQVSVHCIASDTKGLSVRITDNGRGMTQEELSRLGEPFFSSKPVGEGMGLGVFLAKLFVERLGGELRFSSVPGEGSKVEFSLFGYAIAERQRKSVNG